MFNTLNHPRHTYFSGASLKIIAMISMFIDHFAAFILMPWLNSLIFDHEVDAWVGFYNSCRAIGRLAFPIFCFLLVEGFSHTSNLKKYLVRLGTFALISEIPFDLAKSLSIIDLSYQNVYFTLFLGLITIYLVDKYQNIFIKIIIIIAVAGISYLLKTDYDVVGILFIVMLHSFRNYRFYQSLAGSIFYYNYSPFGIPAFLLTYLYNGQRGELNSKIFYWFYPLHLLIYAAIRYIITQ